MISFLGINASSCKHILQFNYTGNLAAAIQIVIKLPQIALALSLGVMPVFAQMNSDNKDNKEELRKLFYKLIKINSIIYGIIGFFLLTTSWYFIPYSLISF